MKKCQKVDIYEIMQLIDKILRDKLILFPQEFADKRSSLIFHGKFLIQINEGIANTVKILDETIKLG